MHASTQQRDDAPIAQQISRFTERVADALNIFQKQSTEQDAGGVQAEPPATDLGPWKNERDALLGKIRSCLTEHVQSYNMVSGDAVGSGAILQKFEKLMPVLVVNPKDLDPDMVVMFAKKLDNLVTGASLPWKTLSDACPEDAVKKVTLLGLPVDEDINLDETLKLLQTMRPFLESAHALGISRLEILRVASAKLKDLSPSPLDYVTSVVGSAAHTWQNRQRGTSPLENARYAVQAAFAALAKGAGNFKNLFKAVFDGFAHVMGFSEFNSEKGVAGKLRHIWRTLKTPNKILGWLFNLFVLIVLVVLFAYMFSMLASYLLGVVATGVAGVAAGVAAAPGYVGAAALKGASALPGLVASGMSGLAGLGSSAYAFQQANPYTTTGILGGAALLVDPKLRKQIGVALSTMWGWLTSTLGFLGRVIQAVVTGLRRVGAAFHAGASAVIGTLGAGAERLRGMPNPFTGLGSVAAGALGAVGSSIGGAGSAAWHYTTAGAKAAKEAIAGAATRGIDTVKGWFGYGPKATGTAAAQGNSLGGRRMRRQARKQRALNHVLQHLFIKGWFGNGSNPGSPKPNKWEADVAKLTTLTDALHYVARVKKFEELEKKPTATTEPATTELATTETATTEPATTEPDAASTGGRLLQVYSAHGRSARLRSRHDRSADPGRGLKHVYMPYD